MSDNQQSLSQTLIVLNDGAISGVNVSAIQDTARELELDEQFELIRKVGDSEMVPLGQPGTSFQFFRFGDSTRLFYKNENSSKEGEIRSLTVTGSWDEPLVCQLAEAFVSNRQKQAGDALFDKIVGALRDGVGQDMDEVALAYIKSGREMDVDRDLVMQNQLQLLREDLFSSSMFVDMLAREILVNYSQIGDLANDKSRGFYRATLGFEPVSRQTENRHQALYAINKTEALDGSGYIFSIGMPTLAFDNVIDLNNDSAKFGLMQEPLLFVKKGANPLIDSDNEAQVFAALNRVMADGAKLFPKLLASEMLSLTPEPGVQIDPSLLNGVTVQVDNPRRVMQAGGLDDRILPRHRQGLFGRTGQTVSPPPSDHREDFEIGIGSGAR